MIKLCDVCVLHSALAVTPNEPKALFRRAQALEKLGNAAEAFRDVKMLLHVDPKVSFKSPLLLSGVVCSNSEHMNQPFVK